MKKISIYVVMLCSCLAALAQENTGETIVFKGHTDTVYNGLVVVIYNRAVNLVDSAKIINGGFTFTEPFKGPGRYMFYSKYEAKKKGGYAPYGILVAKPGTAEMETDMESMANTVVKNAPDNDLYTEFSKLGNERRQKIMDQLNGKYGADFIKKLTEKDPKYKEVIAYYNDLNAANNAIEAIRLESFVKLHPDSFASIYLLNSMAGNIPADKAQALYNLVGARYKTSSYGTDITKKIEAMKLTAIGKIAPDFEQPDTSGKVVKLSGFRGQYVLIDFWASWCGPCRAENPNVVKAYQQYHDKGFTVLGVSLDRPGKKDAWLAAIHHDHLTWTHVSDLQFWNNAVAKLYGIQAIPQNFLLDKDGKIIAANIRGEELDKKLSEIFRN